MNNAYAMSASFEARKNSRAAMITMGFAGLMILLMFMVKWTLPVIEHPLPTESFEVALNLEEVPPPSKVLGGGGGGGNPVQAPERAGVDRPTPPPPGIKDESKDIATNDDDKTSPAILRPNNPKPVKKIVENASPVKTPPKPVVAENPAP